MKQLRIFPVDPFDDLFKDIRSIFGRGIENYNENQSTFAPSTNISENDAEYLLDIALPAVDKTDVKINVDNGVLIISGERKEENTVKGKNIHRSEFYHGEFKRSFVLPEDVKGEDIKASHENGVLHLILPKSSKPDNSISIQIT